MLPPSKDMTMMTDDSTAPACCSVRMKEYTKEIIPASKILRQNTIRPTINIFPQWIANRSFPTAMSTRVQHIPINAAVMVLLQMNSDIFNGDTVILSSVPVSLSRSTSSKTILHMKRRNMMAIAGRI